MTSDKWTHGQRGAAGFTLVEILVTVSIMVVLAGLLVPAIISANRLAKKTSVRDTLRELQIAMDAYRSENPARRFPAPQADTRIGPSVLNVLEKSHLWSWGSRQRNTDGCLLDPWKAPYCYSLVRPAPSIGATFLQRWNWSVADNHESRWGVRPDKALGGPLPFAYLWSTGTQSTPDDASTWIFIEDGQ